MYWFTVPAIMKGWLDRVLTLGFAYSQEKRYSQGIFKVRHQIRGLHYEAFFPPFFFNLLAFCTEQESHAVLYHRFSGVHVQCKWH